MKIETDQAATSADAHMKEEGNEFHELYNEAKLQQPIKKIEVNHLLL